MNSRASLREPAISETLQQVGHLDGHACGVAPFLGHAFVGLFLGVDGIDTEVGVTTPDPQEATLNTLMIRVSREVVGVFDSSKFGQRCLSVIAPLSGLHAIFTDTGASSEHVRALEEAGVQVKLV